MNNIDNVFKYFKEISKIPRETLKEKQISDYLVNFARERNLEFCQDGLFNVVIKKKSNIDNYSGPAVILQGHMDMVYEKDTDSGHVYENGIEVTERDGFLYANKTTLGADNGIALAYCLAILDSNDIKYPDLEVVITSQEEGGLAGAQAINTENLKGKYLINLDSEEEGVFFTSSAGGVRNYVQLSIIKEKMKYDVLLSVKISGLKGGHSGIEIDMERGNAIKLMGRIIHKINGPDIHLASVQASGKANAISNKSTALLAVPSDKVESLKKVIKQIGTDFKKELQFTDNIDVDADVFNCGYGEKTIEVYTEDIKNKLINILMLIPNGVINKSFAIPGLVQTSTNVGALEENEGFISILNSTRSSVESQKYNVADTIKVIASINGAECEFFNDYPQWEYKPKSRLRDIAVNIYEETFNKKARLTAIHAGLECGYFDKKLKDVDIISMGPDLFEVHTTNEHAGIDSIKNVWTLLIKILEKLSVE